MLNDKVKISGIYQSISNVSLIDSEVLGMKNNPINKTENNIKLKTFNAARKTARMVALKIKIFDIEKNVNVFVADEENFNYNIQNVQNGRSKFKC